MALRFENKVVVVTGAASGIGFATAGVFAREGATVIVNDLNANAAETAVAKLIESGGNAYAVAGDVSSEDTVTSNVNEILDRFGRVDVLVNNAGISTVSPAESYTKWKTMLAVNLDGPFYWSQKVAVASMIPNQSGSIVNVASLSGVVAHAYDVGYIAAKHGVVGLTKGLALDWAIHGIRVNAICPGLTETPILATISDQEADRFDQINQRIPMQRRARPEEQAHAIAFLASEEASYITGAILNVDGGILALKSLFPPRTRK